MPFGFSDIENETRAKIDVLKIKKIEDYKNKLTGA